MQNKHGEMQKMEGKRQAEWRRNHVLELTSKGNTQSKISTYCKSAYQQLAGIYPTLEKSKDTC